MATLYLLRHAHAGDASRWEGDDDLRPLSAKGRRQAERLGRLLAAGRDEGPDLLVTSPRLRAAQTAELVGRALDIPVVEDRRVVGPLYAELVEDIVTAAGATERPCLVGHDPDFSELLGELIGVAVVPMRKGAIARVDFEGRIRSGRGVIRLLLPPELIPDG
jgi:phosphohistidine phosphatase SixA